MESTGTPAAAHARRHRTQRLLPGTRRGRRRHRARRGAGRRPTSCTTRPTFDHDEVRRHVTVLALTPTRLIVGHTDEHPRGRDVADPVRVRPRPRPCVSSGSTRSWSPGWPRTRRRTAPARRPARGRTDDRLGRGRRIDLEPAGCGDPECDADHGYTGTATDDDLVAAGQRGRRRRRRRRAGPGVRAALSRATTHRAR